MKVLAFSGGKDSWACLWLNKDRLDNIVVVWVNTGKNYPEMLETIALAKSICPNFGEITVDRDGQNAYHGIPAEIVPVNWTRFGQKFTSEKSVMIQAYTNCCYENIGKNLHEYCIQRGYTEMIRGQRNSEGHKSTARDGDVVDGITYRQPIENWSSQEVLEFNAKHMQIPDHFRFNHTSMDCYDCTAFAKESKDRVAYMEQKYPLLYAEYKSRNDALQGALKEALEIQ